MPKAWSNKRERQYEHIKESERKQGRSTKRAKEIAAATVNKKRAQTGEAKSSRSRSSSSSSGSRSASSRSGSTSRSSSDGGKTREQLYRQAQRLGIGGRSKMNKEQLQRAVSRKK
jgi:hypothetical protein